MKVDDAFAAILAKHQTSYEAGDRQRIQGFLEQHWGEHYTTNYIGRVIAGERSNDRIYRLAIRYFLEKGKMDQRLYKWMQNET